MKLLMMILPLLTGGALAGVLAKFGIRLPAGLDKIVGERLGAMVGGASAALGKWGVSLVSQAGEELRDS